MPDTANLSLPLLQPAQAQKHVTVNEALVRLDGLAQLCLSSVSQTVPPAAPAEGAAWGVPAGAVNAWAGQGGTVAVFVSGGWVFVPARRGWRAQVLDAGGPAIFDGAAWRPGALSLSAGGAALAVRVAEMDVVLAPGGAVTTALSFPARAIAFGVTGRVVSAITGAATAWDLGVPGDPVRYGAGLGLSLNSWVGGPIAPEVLWETTPVVVTPAGGDFAGGMIRLAAHYADLALPDPV
ncbi:DUF2793 domain-containing protein [Roseibacterium sp. SDUM158016]|jgi:hypothetical protein|uniref:DUF2793 domain-containing protein n=1 Tax=Roseicyclus sediminis TaxID=2980997 RepID=UPI0021CE8E53|nr:DUF2793 domain-containing protein [Roseibacterium sp. SDUM158016]MCU4653343.1 DUF2793 domain-containing protein [Roseibacterium sp. SDUM158016]